MIIGIIGQKRSGKDTVANILTKDYGFSKYAFADPIKEICKIIFGWEDVDEDYDKEKMEPIWGLSRRKALQLIGTDMFQFDLPKHSPTFDHYVGRNLWAMRFEQWYENICQNPDVVVSDVRFQHEYDVLKRMNAKFIKVDRGTANIDNHPSESAIDTLPYDYLLENTKGLGDLAIGVHQIMNPLY